MLTKQDIDLYLSIAKPETPQDKQLVEYVRYDLYKMIEEYELHEKHFQNEIKKFKYVRAKPQIEKLENRIKELQQLNQDLIENNQKLKDAVKSAKRHCKKLNKFMENQLWYKLVIKKLNDTQRLLSNYKEIDRNLDEIEIILEGKNYDK